MHPLFRFMPRMTLMASLSLSLLPSQAAQADEVVTSIRPLGLIAAALTDGITQPQVLLADGASPHHYALRPSDMRALTEAKVVFWVGPELEQFLDKPLARTDALTVALIESEADHDEHDHHDEADHHDEHDHHDEADHHDEHDHDDEADHHDEHEHHGEADDHDEHDHDEHEDHDEAGHHHDHGGLDVHPWLDPDKALNIAQKMHDVLLDVYPQQQAQLDSNLAAFQAQMEQVNQQIEQQLASVQGQGFYVFHDAYGGFVGHYGLNQLGYFTVDPGRKPGARHLAEIRDRLEQNHAVCVMTEPQFNPDLIQTIIEGLDLNQGELDPLASGRTPTAQSYGEFLLDMADRFERCLSTEGQN